MAQEDEELVFLFFDDLFGSSLKGHEYLAERRSLVLRFSSNAELQKALAEKTYAIDDDHIFSVCKLEAAGPRPQQRATVFVKPMSKGLPPQDGALSVTLPAVQDGAATEFQSDRFDQSLADGKVIDFDYSEKKAVAGLMAKSLSPAGSIESSGPNAESATNLKRRVAVPMSKCGLIIGKGGATIREICAKSGAYLHIQTGPTPIPGHRICIIKGSAEQIECARQHMSRAARVPLTLMESTDVAAPDVCNPSLDTKTQHDISEGGRFLGGNHRAVEVTGIASSTSKKCLEVYFRNELKSGGGEVESISYASGSGSAIVVFEDPAVASRVAAKGSHVVQGTDIDVHLWESAYTVGRKESFPTFAPVTFDDTKQRVKRPYVGSGRLCRQVPSSISSSSAAEGPTELRQRGMAGLGNTLIVMCELGAYVCAEAIACWLKLAAGSWPHTVCYVAASRRAMAAFDRADVHASGLSGFAEGNPLNGQTLQLQLVEQWSAIQVLASGGGRGGGSELVEGGLKEQFPTADSVDVQSAGRALIKFASCADADQAFSRTRAAKAAAGLCVVPYVDELGCVEREQVFYFDEARTVLRAKSLQVLPQLVVLGIAAEIDVSLLEKFFSNTSKTGGGSIRSFVCNNSRAVIAYVQADDCHKVVNASKRGMVSFCDRKLPVAVKSFQADGHYKDKVLLRNVAEASLDELKYLVWAVGGCPVQQVEFVRLADSGELCALVQLCSPSSDFGRLSHGLQVLTLNGAVLELDFVPVSCSILVKKVPASAHRDLVELACAIDGRSVTSCEPCASANEWKVTFADPTDAERAVTKPIIFDSRTALEATLYLSYRPAEPLPDGRARRELLLTFAAATVLRFVLDHRPPGLDELLLRHGCTCAFLPGGGSQQVAVASLARPPSDPAYGQLCKDWPQLRFDLARYLHEFTEASISASAAQLGCTDDRLLVALQAALDGIVGGGVGRSDGVGADPPADTTTAAPVTAAIAAAADGSKIVRCVGSKAAVGRLKERLRAALDAIRDEAEKRRTMASHTVKDVEPWFVELLGAADFQRQLRERSIDVQAVTNVAQREVTLIGAKLALDRACEALTVARQQAFTERHRLACAALYTLLSKDGIRARVAQALAADKLHQKAIWLLEPPATLVVHAVNLVSAKKAADCIKRQLSFRAVRLPSDSESAQTAVDVGTWKEALLLSSAAAAAGLSADRVELELTESVDGARDIIVACEASTIDMADREIRRLSSHNTIEQTRYRLHPLAAAYLADRIAIVQSVQEAHAQNHVVATLDDGPSSPALVVKGNSVGTAAFVRSLRSQLALDRLTARTYTLAEPGAAVHFASAAAAEVLQDIAKSTGTIFKLGDVPLEQPQPPAQPTSDNSLDCRAVGDSGGCGGGDGKVDFLLPDGLVLCVRHGSMAGIDCDVMVSSADSKLAHSQGLAKAIAEAGGDAVIEACRSHRLRLGVLSEGDVVDTTPGRLPCKLLLHAVAPVWRDGMQDEEGKLRRAVRGCLQLCDDKRLSSIALPAIGCGARGYPPEQAVATIVDEVKKYLGSRQSNGSTVSKITFVDVDSDRVQQFCSAIESAFSVSAAKIAPTEPLYIGVRNRSRKSLVVASPSSGRAGSQTAVEQVSTEYVDLITGSLEDQTAEVLVAPVAPDLDLSRGRVSSALSDSAGPALESELKKNNPYGVPEGRIAVTSGHSLQSSLVFFAHCPEARRHVDSQERLRKLILECLQEAEQRGKRSIALPALGTGHGHFTSAAAASAMADAVDDYRKKNHASKLRILVVVGDPQMVADYRQHLLLTNQTKPAAKSESSRGSGRGTEAFVWKTRELQDAAGSSRHHKPEGKGPGSAVLFTICGTSKKDITKAAIMIGEHCFQHMQKCSITKPKDVVSVLSKSQLEDMQSYGRERDVGVSLEVANGETAVTLRSLDLKSTLDVMQLFNDALVSEHDAQVADEDLFKSVRWRYRDGAAGEWRDYCPSLNRRLEEARKAKQPAVKYRSGSLDYAVDLDSNQDACVQLMEAAAEIRREEVSSASIYPATWTPSQSYLEVALNEQSPEYQQVYSLFIKSLQQPRRVLAIRRIQNPPLWQQYAALRNEVEAHVSALNKPQVERFLWHGAPADTIEHICHSRFDRSHSGKNAVAYGQGVYFARDASYSAQDLYSVPNMLGEKHVIYCQVLTGDFEVGNQNTRVPNIQPGQTMVRYDCTVNNVLNPSIFVTYHDAQAYPAYVIKFQ